MGLKNEKMADRLLESFQYTWNYKCGCSHLSFGYSNLTVKTCFNGFDKYNKKECMDTLL